MKLNFAKLSPTRNMTILVRDAVPRPQQSGVAAALMVYGSVGAEQVGFLEAPSLPGARLRLQMMGGEFCGNASMSAAALLALGDGLADGEERIYPLEVSGAEGLVNCRMLRRGEGYLGTVSMPLPRKFEAVDGHPAVFFDGIVHVLAHEDEMTDAQAEAFAAKACAELGADALGVLLLNGNEDAFRPLVYVRETGSAVWEHGCGSGTAALGAYAAQLRRGDVRLSFLQPGGRMQVRAAWREDRVAQIEISGEVRIAAIGEAWIDAGADFPALS